MRSRMKYFAAVKLPVNVHIAWTKYQPDQFVRCDLSREAAFAHFNQMPEVVVFDNMHSAQRYADKQYYATAKRNSFGMFEENPQKKSNDAELLNIYGEDVVRMKEMPMTVLFQVDGDMELKDKCENVRHNDEIYRGYKVTGENKASLTLDYAAVPGVVLHVSDVMAKAEKSPVTIELIDHKQMTAKPGCVIL